MMTPRTDKEKILALNGWTDFEAADAELAKVDPNPRADKSVKSTIGTAQLICIVGLGGIFVMTLAGLT